MTTTTIMEETTTTNRTRRRHPQNNHHNNDRKYGIATKNPPPNILLVPSGGSDDVSPSPNHKTLGKTQRTKRRRRRRRRKEEPFHLLVLKVGTTLLLFCFVLHSAYRLVWPSSLEADYEYDDDDDGNAAAAVAAAMTTELSQDLSHTAKDEVGLEKLLQAAEDVEGEGKEKTAPPLPTFELSEAADWDVFGILDQLEETTTVSSSNPFWNAAKGLRRRFAETYGGENAARMLLDQGLSTYNNNIHKKAAVPNDVVSTACRLQTAKRDDRPFRVAFGGYSVTAGRGNHFEESFPFQMKDYLSTVFRLAGIPDLEVNNAAIGGCPAFPYGWCMTNFWGPTPDVVSWDYSMNEAGGVPEGLEAYVRHVLNTYRGNVPKLIVKDSFQTAGPRRQLLGEYATLLRDPVVLHPDPAVQPFLDRREEFRPVGFQDWRKFGAPYGAPGQASHHPAVKEHELIGWILAMHFLTALEYLVGTPNLQCPVTPPISTLPKPVSESITNNTMKYDQLLFGYEHEQLSQEWKMNPVSCRTTFQPILSGDLSEIVVSGTTAEDLDVLLPKSQMYYNQGWTLDMSVGEKAAKRKLSLYENSLGFVDSKEAYYGIYESPPIQLLLPYEGSVKQQKELQIDTAAKDWFESIVLCQVNEKRGETACNFGFDLGVRVGGANATMELMKDMGTLYLGKPVCAKIKIPENAKLTSHNVLAGAGSEAAIQTDQVGVLVEVAVTNPHINHVDQACSISHVVWETKPRQSR